MLAELIGEVIPNQRIERIEGYLRRLDARLDAHDETLSCRLREPERVELFEEGARQSTQALTEERRDYIANLVTYGLTGDEKARIEAKRLLSLLNEIDDAQIISLTSKLHRHRSDSEFFSTHEAVLAPVGAHMGSPPEEHEREVMFELARSELLRLGLLNLSFWTPKKGELPEFDRHTGTVKARGQDLSQVGRMLLARIGIAEPGEM